MAEIAYVSEVRVERLGGPLRAAHLPGEEEPTVYPDGGRAQLQSIVDETLTPSIGHRRRYPNPA